MARRRVSASRRAPPAKRRVKFRVPSKLAERMKSVATLDGFRVTCSGCFEEFVFKPREDGGEIVCPLCDHSSEPPRQAFLDQMTRYALRERRGVLRSVVPVTAAFVLALAWIWMLTARSSVPLTGLSAGISADATEIPVASTRGFPKSGTLAIGPSVHQGELISYEGISEGSFTGALREQTSNNTPSAHGIGATVYSKSYRSKTLMFSIVLILAILGLVGYGVYSGFGYEKSRWVAYF